MTSAGQILVVDDSRTVLDSIRGTLTTEGYEVRIALDLPGAARQVRGCDLCIVDLHMPGLDGNRLLVTLKAAVGGPCVFYLYTSDVEAAKRAKGLRLRRELHEEGRHGATPLSGKCGVPHSQDGKAGPRVMAAARTTPERDRAIVPVGCR